MLVFWLLGCTDQGFTLRLPDPLASEPDIQVSPGAVLFDPLALGCSDRTPVTITNVGAGPLDVEGTSVQGSDEGPNDYTVEFLSGTLRPGDSETVQLQFEPSLLGGAVAELIVDSDDPDEPRLVLPIEGASFDATWTLDVFAQAPDSIDVLWVIDNSGSMYQERDRVMEEIEIFFQWFLDLDLDYHMGVITTDILNPAYSGNLVGSPTYVTRATPEPQAALARNIDVGHLEMGDESGLEAMRLALTEPLLSAHNAGFYRDEARLAVIFLSDEPDYSPLEVPGYDAFLEGLKEDREAIFVAAIVGDRLDGCSNSCGAEEASADPGDRYLDLAEAFEGFEESICTCDLAPAMERIGFESTFYLRSFGLTQTPGEPSLLKVWLDGALAAGWSYDPGLNAVVFDTAPPLGSQVVVRYPLDNPCP
ncbi:MAG: choice-of-anchor D domain-containing protein [Pseudomonadota bacterium]|nr:choice-of-anchor D domain-containing protein [Pseudomonadota bacterium]